MITPPTIPRSAERDAYLAPANCSFRGHPMSSPIGSSAPQSKSYASIMGRGVGLTAFDRPGLGPSIILRPARFSDPEPAMRRIWAHRSLSSPGINAVTSAQSTFAEVSGPEIGEKHVPQTGVSTNRLARASKTRQAPRRRCCSRKSSRLCATWQMDWRPNLQIP
jgi:hypothetical protein